MEARWQLLSATLPRTMISALLNILWVVLGGFVMALGW